MTRILNIPTDQRRSLCDATHVTLNGEPARVVGSLLPFAKVQTIDPRGPSIEFAWPMVAGIVARDGRFSS